MNLSYAYCYAQCFYINQRKNKEESEEIEEYRKAVAKEKEERLLTEVKSISSVPQTKQLKPTTIASSIGITNQTQKSHLNAFVVKRKSLESHGSVVKKLKSAEGKQFKLASFFFNLQRRPQITSCCSKMQLPSMPHHRPRVRIC